MQILSTGEQGPTYWPIAIPLIGLTIILALGLLEFTWKPWRLPQKSPSIQKFLRESYLKKKDRTQWSFQSAVRYSHFIVFLTVHIPDECFKNAHNIKKDQNLLPQNTYFIYEHFYAHGCHFFHLESEYFMIEFLEGIVFLSGQWYSYLLILVKTDLGFKTMVGPCTWVSHYLHTLDFSAANIC